MFNARPRLAFTVAAALAAATFVSGAEAQGRLSLSERVQRLESQMQGQGSGQSTVELLNRLNELQQEVSSLRGLVEQMPLARPMSGPDIERLYMLRRDLLRLRNAVGPLVDVCGRLSNADLPQIHAAMQPMFRDVTDHIRTVQEKIDSLREVLAFAFEASLLVGQSQETAISKRLAGWAAILAVPTAIAGIYGMNFKHMPELDFEFGYYLILALMGGICGLLYWRFRRAGWL